MKENKPEAISNIFELDARSRLILASPYRSWVEHFSDFVLDAFGQRVRDGNGGYVKDFRSCRSATCPIPEHREDALKDRLKVLRFACRDRGVRMMTLTKFVSPDTADDFILAMRKFVRRGGYYFDDYCVIEWHDTGLLHVHCLIDSDCPDEILKFIFDLDVRERLDLTEWSEFQMSNNADAWNATYLLKNAEKNLPLHLALNGGRLHRKHTPAFFRRAGVGSMASMLKAERSRNRYFNRLAGLVGKGEAERLTAGLILPRELGCLVMELTTALRIVWLRSAGLVGVGCYPCGLLGSAGLTGASTAFATPSARSP